MAGRLIGHPGAVGHSQAARVSWLGRGIGSGAFGSWRRYVGAVMLIVAVAALAVFAGASSARASTAPAQSAVPAQQQAVGAQRTPVTAQVVPAAPAAPAGQIAPLLQAPESGQCSVAQWQNPADFSGCVGKLQDLTSSRLQCLSPPAPETPDSGLAGWFAAEPPSSARNGPKGLYSRYGYAGYDYTTYDIGCISPLTHPTATFEDTVANGEFMVATSVTGASNALREKAWDPGSMWGWADSLIENATRSIYTQVFTVFGAITLAIVGLYLLWRSRQADMSVALTTAGWALLVMVAVTAIAAWPVRSAHLADAALVKGLDVVHSAVSPPEESTAPIVCPLPDKGACVDHRPPAVRASDTATETLLYRNWLRGLLGSANSPTAIKYGPVLYDSRSLTWQQAQQIEQHPDTRDAVLSAKQQEWLKVAEQIKTEDPQAYNYLQGNQGMDRIGAGFIAILSALFFAMFDITASVLVLIGFLIVRWAVVAAPILGTVGLLRPASGGIRRLANAVVAAVFNVVIFGTGAAIYLYAVDLVMNTTTLPGWLQVVLVLLVGVVGWLLLRPYRRLTQLGGKDPTGAVSQGSWHRRFFRDARAAARLEVAEEQIGRRELTVRRARELEAGPVRPEGRAEDATVARTADRPLELEGRRAAPVPTPRRRPESGRPAGDWTEPDVPTAPANYSIYRPEGSRVSTEPEPTPARRPESSPIGR
jgi:hypothetical protein